MKWLRPGGKFALNLLEQPHNVPAKWAHSALQCNAYFCIFSKVDAVHSTSTMQQALLISLDWTMRHKYCARNDHNFVSHPKVNNWTFDFQFTLSYGVHSGIRCVGWNEWTHFRGGWGVWPDGSLGENGIAMLTRQSELFPNTMALKASISKLKHGETRWF